MNFGIGGGYKLKEAIAHVDLTDMPDIGGTNTDHDSRYYTEAEIDTNFVNVDGTTDLTGDWTISTNDITLTAGTLTANGLAMSTLTEGSVLFSGAAGALSQNNTKFFWDNTFNKLGIGIGDPKCELHFGAAIPVVSSGNSMYVGCNVYRIAAGWRRIAASNPVMLNQMSSVGDHVWFGQSDANATADSAITLVQRLKLYNSGVLLASNKIAFTQTDFNEYIDSLNDGYMDYGATTAHRFNNKVDIITGATTSSAVHIGEAVNEGMYLTSLFDSQMKISGGAEEVTGSWIARATSANIIIGYNGKLTFYTDSALTDGNAYTPTNRMSIDDDGIVNISGSNLITARLGQNLQLHSSSSYGGIALNTWSESNNETNLLDFNKSGSNTIGTYTVVADTETLGRISFRGADGTNFETAASIRCIVDGTPGNNDMPGALIFLTTPNGATSEVEHIRIKEDGNTRIGASASTSYTQIGALGHVLLPAGTAAAGTGPLKFTAGTLLATPEAGAMEYTDSRVCITNVATCRAIDRTSDVAVSTVTVANTVVETLLWTGYMPANSLVAGNVFKFHADGIVSNASAAGADQVTIRVKVGGATIATLTPLLRSFTNEMWHIDANATQRTIGNPGVRAIHLMMIVSSTSITSLVGVANINTEANMDVTVTAQWASAKAANTISLYQGFMEYKN